MPQMGLKLPPDTLLTPSRTRIQGWSHCAIENKGFFLIGHQKASLACFASRNRSGGCHHASNGLKTSSRHPPDTLPNIEDPGIEPSRHRKQRFFLIGHQKGSFTCFATPNRSGGLRSRKQRFFFIIIIFFFYSRRSAAQAVASK